MAARREVVMFRNHKFLVRVSPSGTLTVAMMPNALIVKMNQELEADPDLMVIPGMNVTQCYSEADVRHWLSSRPDSE